METQPKPRIKKILYLIHISAPEIIIGLGFIIVLFTYGAVSAYLEELAVVNSLQTIVNSTGERLGTFLDTPFVTNAVTIFFWALVGLVLYSLCWTLFVVLMDIRNDIVTAEYFVHPRSFHKSSFWLASISRRVVIITAYTIIIVYVVLLLRSLPIVYESVRTLFRQSYNDLPVTTLSTLLAIASWLLGWHLIAIVRRFSITFTKEV